MASPKKKTIDTRLFISVDDVYRALDDGYTLSDQFPFSHPSRTKGKEIYLSLGRIWFNLLLPPKFRLVDEVVNDKKIGDIIKECTDLISPDEMCDFISVLNQEAFRLSVYTPSSFTIDSLIIPDDIKKKKEELHKIGKDLSLSDYTKTVNEISDELSDNAEANDYRINNVLISGAKGGKRDWNPLMISKGYVTDIEGNLNGPILNSLSDGLNPDDFYDAAGEARRGFYYKSAISAEPGYLSRRVTMANAAMVINDKIEDCGTHQYFNLLVDNKLSQLLVGRYYYDDKKNKNILIADPKQIVNKTILLRSPLYCKSPGSTICPICYGNSYEKLETKNIGVLAGGVINNIVLNAYMKMRHKSSIPEQIKVNFISDLTKNNLYTPEFRDFFDVSETTIKAKRLTYVNINTDDYDNNFFIESNEYYLVPGIITPVVYIEDDQKRFSFPFPYQVKLRKTSNMEIGGHDIIITYEPDDIIIEQDFYVKDVDVSLVQKLLEGHTKYINRPELLVLAIHDQLPGMDLVGLELIVQNMFRDASDNTIQARHTDYTNFEIFGQKKLPFITSWESALSFEDPKKAIKNGLLSGQNSVEDPITSIVNEKYK